MSEEGHFCYRRELSGTGTTLLLLDGNSCYWKETLVKGRQFLFLGGNHVAEKKFLEWEGKSLNGFSVKEVNS
jgi:hypothetical protein